MFLKIPPNVSNKKRKRKKKLEICYVFCVSVYLNYRTIIDSASSSVGSLE